MRILYLLTNEPALSETFVENERLAVMSRREGDDVGRIIILEGSLRTLLADFSATAFLRAVRSMNGSVMYRIRNALLVGLAIRRVRRSRPDLIHTHFLSSQFLTAAEVARQIDVPVTVLAHAADYRSKRAVTESSRVIESVVRNERGRLFVISESARSEMRALGYPDSVMTSAVIVRPSVAPVLPSWRPVSDRAIVTVARLVPKKGVDRVLEAVAELRRRGCVVRYHIAGAGPEGERLRLLAKDLDIDGQVTFLGALAHDDALRLTAGASVAVLLGRVADDGDRDGMPVFLLESAGIGIPVLATRVSGIPDLSQSPEQSLLPVDSGATEIADELARLLDDGAYGRARAAEFGARFRIEFSPAVQASRLWSVWRGLHA